MIQRCVIAGASGGFGRLLSGLLIGSGVEVIGVDLAADPGRPTEGSPVLIGDITRPTGAILEAIRTADGLVMCLPEAALFAALGPAVEALPADALLVDTTSVKTPYARAIADRSVRQEVLSLNPMFAPDVGFPGQDVASVSLRPGPRSRHFEGLIRGWGARVVPLSAEEHDRLAAMAQVAAHASILAYGACLADLGRDPAASFSTPPQRSLLALVRRITGLDPEVYWHIQRDNPFAAHARRSLRDALESIDRAVETGDLEAFRRLLAAAADAAGPPPPAG